MFFRREPSCCISFTGSSLQYKLATELRLLRLLSVRILILLFLALPGISYVCLDWHKGLCA